MNDANSHENSSETQGLYKSLTPHIDVGDNVYEHALYEAMTDELHPDVRNIAITGPYGSGKSSLLYSFKQKHPSFKYAFVSLAHFKEDPKTELSPEDSSQSEIEQSIVQQLIYSVHQHDIPNSRFSRINTLDTKSALGYAAFIMVTILLILFLGSDWATTSLKAGWGELTTLSISGFFILYYGVVLTKLIQRFFYSSVKSIEIAGQIKVENEQQHSVFNQHLDEIIYFFEATKTDVVVFEDLDRFNRTDVFIKLREINLLIKQSDHVRHPVWFVYAVRDDLFMNKDRVKFFDFIIPVIPVVNATNSYEACASQLARVFKHHTQLTPVDEQLIRNAALYIDDMRLIRNICNEFNIYLTRLVVEANIHLNIDKLFAFIVIKNLYPDEFSKLNRNNGIIAAVFNNLTVQKKIRKNKIDHDIQALQNEQEDIQELLIDSWHDLSRLVLYEIYRMLQGLDTNNQSVTSIDYLEISERQLSAGEMLTDAMIYQLLSGESFNVVFTATDNEEKENTSQLTLKLHDIAIEEFKPKADILKKREDQRQSRIIKRIQTLEHDSKHIEELPIFQFIKQHPDTELLSDISNKPLLVMLFRSGYIEEDYGDYLSYFYPGTLTIRDKNFLLAVKEGRILPPDYVLDNVAEIRKNISEKDSVTCLFNFQLLDYLLANNDKRLLPLINMHLFLDEGEPVDYSVIHQPEQQAKRLNCSKVINDPLSVRSATFLVSALVMLNQTERFLQWLDAESAHILYLYNHHNKFSTLFTPALTCMDINSSHELLLKALKKLSDTWLADPTRKNVKINQVLLRHVLAKLSDPFELVNTNEQTEISKVYQISKHLPVHYRQISRDIKIPDFYHFICKHRLFAINQYMIDMLMKKCYSTVVERSKYPSWSFSTVIATKNEGLIQGLLDHMTIYIEKVIANNGKHRESEEALIMMLNTLDDEHYIQRLIDELDFEIRSPESINNPIAWYLLLFNNRFPIRWETLNSHYVIDEKNWTIQLDAIAPVRQFLTNNYLLLSEQSGISHLLADHAVQLLLQQPLLQEPSANDEILTVLLPVFNPVTLHESDAVKPSHISILLQHGLLNFSDENTKYLLSLSDHKQDNLSANALFADYIALHYDAFFNLYRFDKLSVDSWFELVAKLESTPEKLEHLYRHTPEPLLQQSSAITEHVLHAKLEKRIGSFSSLRQLIEYTQHHENFSWEINLLKPVCLEIEQSKPTDALALTCLLSQEFNQAIHSKGEIPLADTQANREILNALAHIQAINKWSESKDGLYIQL